MTHAGRNPSVVRFGVILLLALAAGSAYLTRYCISVANTTIQGELELSDQQMGWVFSAFAAGYFICQIPGGWLGNRIGTRAAYALISVLWSLMTIWTSMARALSSLVASRVAFGMAQAGLVPLSAQIIKDWFAVHRRGICSALVNASMSVGGVVAMWLTARLITGHDWRDIFRLYSLVGIVWAVGFYAYFRTRPEKHPWLNEAELGLIRDEGAGTPVPPERGESEAMRAEAASPVTTAEADGSRGLTTDELLMRLASSRTIWGIYLQSFFKAAAYMLFVTWFPAFLEYRFDLSPAQAGGYTTWPLSMLILGTVLAGFVVDYLLQRTGDKRISRSLTASVSLGVCCLLTFASSWVSEPVVFVVLMSLGAFFAGCSGPCMWAATMDVAGRYTAVVVGGMNMAGTAGGFCMPIVLGYMIGDIRETGGDWNLVIYFVAAVYLAAALSWLMVDSRTSPTTDP